MRYTVWSHGQEIGETDLGFCRFLKGSRSGWFHPNAAGEKLMPIIDAVSSAMLAYMHRNTRDASGQPIIHPEFIGSKAFTDAAEAFARAASLELEIRREDGSVVSGSSVGLQDCQQYRKLEDIEIIDWIPDDEELEDTDSLVGLEELQELGALDKQEPSWESDGWTPENLDERSMFSDQEGPSVAKAAGDPALERYQVHVLLDDDDVIP